MIAALKDAGEVVSEVLMTRLAHQGSFLLLEGPDDSRFWEPRVLEQRCEIVIGGCKRSGIGRESGQEMIYEYLQTKSVWIDTATEVPNPFVLR